MGHLLPGVPLWQAGRFTLSLDRVRVMGIVNLTPDSFSDGGRFLDPEAAIAHAQQLVREGAHILDLGAESTRPHAQPVDAQEEWRRLAPVVQAACTMGVVVSVDTHKPQLMRAALQAGADVINDVRALATPGALQALREHPTAGVCLMHSRGDPSTMSSLAHYADLVGEVAQELAERAQAAIAAGIAAPRILLDPGYGFAKTAAQSLALLAQQRALGQALRARGVDRPLLAGLSRKSAIGHLTGREVPAQRLAGSLAAALLAAQRGARVLRVHDVAQTVDALRLWQGVGEEAPMGETVAVGLGANLGPARQTLAAALQQLRDDPCIELEAVSSLYRSAPQQAEGPDYLNAVALLRTTLDPLALLQRLQALETQAGRLRPHRNAARTLDLDLLLFGQRVWDTGALVLPHPRMQQRRFVLQPLAEVAPRLLEDMEGGAAQVLARVAEQPVEVVAGPHWWRPEAG